LGLLPAAIVPDRGFGHGAGYAAGQVKIALGTLGRARARRYTEAVKRLLLLPVALAATPVRAQSAPPLTDLRIVAVTSIGQAERIAPDQRETARRHSGPVTLVVRETGIGRARTIRIDDVAAAPASSVRPLCGAAVTPGACRPGEAMTGVEITYHLGDLPPGTIVAVADVSANPPATALTAAITIR
jgi:hypothetical protein